MRLLTLGGLGLEGSNLTRPKPLLLLTYLALEGSQDKRYVAELFWPDAKSATRSLNVALTQVRASSPEAIEADAHRLATPLATDAQAFLECVEAGTLEAAEARYGGPFLAGVRVPLGVELEEWVWQTREFLAGHARAVALQRAAVDAAEGRFRDAARRAEAAWALPGASAPDPGELARIHELLLAGHSTRTDAVAREAEAFGVEPPGSAEEARRRLRRPGEAAALQAPLSGATPVATTSFVGREQDVRDVTGALEGGERLVSLLGPPGVGKTRLALHCARRMQRRGTFERIVFVGLEAARDEAQLLHTMAAALRPEDAALDGGIDRVAHFVGQGRVLLLLDNFEQLVDSAGLLVKLLAACPELQLLVTSRERLQLQQERAHEVAGLAVPDDATPVDASRSYGAIELFAQRARRVQPDFTLDVDSLPSARDIVRLVDGLPLGLEIAAAWLRVMPVGDVAAELAGNLDLLHWHLRDVPERHRSLRNAIAWSWNLLGPRERSVLARLSVFQGTFTREAAQVVAGASIPLLASLVDTSLVRREPPDRYRLHPLVAQYGRERLAEDPEGTACAARHASYFLDLAERARPHLTGADPGPWLRRLDQDYDDLRAAFSYLRDHDAARAMRLAAALWRFWIIRGHNREGRERLQELVDRPEARSEGALRAWLLRALGTLTFQSGDFARAEPVLEEALTLGRDHCDDGEVATILTTLGWVTGHLGRAQASLAHCNEALRLHQRLGQARGVALAHNDLGFRALFLGSLGQARAHLAESLRQFEALGDERGEAHLNTNVALVDALMGAYPPAEARLAQAVEALSRMGDMQLLVWARYQRAMAAMARARPDEAEADLREALPMARDAGNRELLGAVLTARADRLAAGGRPDEAQAPLAEAFATWRSAGYPWMWALTHRVAARVAEGRDERAAAVAALREALDLSLGIYDRLGVAQAAEALAWAGAAAAPEPATRLLAASDALRNAAPAPRPERFRELHGRTREALRAHLGSRSFQHAWAQGRSGGVDGVAGDAAVVG